MTPGPARARGPVLPTLDLERSLVDGSGLVAGMDEVGRGALAGPVSVGVVVVRLGPDDAATAAGTDVAGQEPVPAHPAVRDSKALSPARREALVAQIRDWAAAAAVGHASPAEIDELGLSVALGVAGRRAWSQVVQSLGGRQPALVLDGRDDWLSRVPARWCAGLAEPPSRVVMQVKADAGCVSVAAASILAKVERDRLMGELDERFPGYGWAGNKGYGSAGHRRALVEQGITVHHRRSWRLLPEDEGGAGARATGGGAGGGAVGMGAVQEELFGAGGAEWTA